MPNTTQLFISSGNGPVTRTVLDVPIREARPEEIPIIDVSGIFSSVFSDREAVADQIRAAALNTGFFYITNHGIPPAVTTAAHIGSLSFFHQPDSVKGPANERHSRHHFGWKSPSTQRVNPFEGVDQRETFSWRYDPKYDPSVPDVAAIPAHIAEHIQHDPDDFPWSATTDRTPEFKADFIPLFQAVLALGRPLLRCFALSLGLEETALDEKFTHPGMGVAVNYYPALPPSSEPEGGGGGKKKTTPVPVSIGSHTDFQLFTLLHQDPSASPTALQVLSRYRPDPTTSNSSQSREERGEIYQWLYAKPIPGTLVVNFGDYMQRITNDRYPSTVHRVQNFCSAEAEEDGRSRSQERLSMAFFFGFNQNESVEVLDCCVDEEKGERKKYETISCHEWTARRLQRMHVVDGADGEGRGGN